MSIVRWNVRLAALICVGLAASVLVGVAPDVDGQEARDVPPSIVESDRTVIGGGELLRSPEPGAVPVELLGHNTVSVDFWADTDALQEGDCTLLNWRVSGVSTVVVENRPVAGTGTMNVCPERDTLFTLEWRRLGDEAPGRQQLLVTVTPADPDPDPVDETFVAYQVAAGTIGNQLHEGPMGMDFDVLQPIRVTHLGAFDSGSDGLARIIDVSIYDRTTEEPVVHLRLFGDDGERIGGSRFIPVRDPLVLDTGFEGSIVAEGYGPMEPNGNGANGPVRWTTDDGQGLIEFVGTGRWDWPWWVESYPKIVDTGPHNRYAAGTFLYKAADDATP